MKGGKESALVRCGWVGSGDLYVRYHDREWGTPEHRDRVLFEFLVLESAQAGLSWITILRKREAYRAAYDNFEPGHVARYGEKEKAALLSNPGIVRNRLKIESSINNARRFLEVQEEFGSFDAYLWSWVDGKPVVGKWKSIDEVPVFTDLSTTLSKNLKSRGFTFLGPTIVYSYLQATGVVNDHVTSCFRFKELARV